MKNTTALLVGTYYRLVTHRCRGCTVLWKSCSSIHIVYLYSVCTCTVRQKHFFYHPILSRHHIEITRLCVLFHLHIFLLIQDFNFLRFDFVTGISMFICIFLLQACLVCSLLYPATWRQIIPHGIGLNPVTLRYPTWTYRPALEPVLGIRSRIRIRRIHMFFGLPDPDPLVRGMNPIQIFPFLIRCWKEWKNACKLKFYTKF